MRPLLRLALRDLGLLGLTLALWRLDAGLRGAPGALAAAVAVAAGALTAVAGYLAHEWGHLSAARFAGSVVHLPESPASPFLFRFDPERNGRREFLAMSAGGFAASAAVVALLLAALPLDALSGRVALALTGLGVLATALLEIPPAWRVLRGGPLPRGGAAYQTTPPVAAR